jgi:hypothetical protein
MSQPDRDPDAPQAEPTSPSPEPASSRPARGTGWWQKSLGAAPSASVTRRAALQGILAAGGVIAGLAASPPEAEAQEVEVRTETHRLIEMQRVYGWSFGAAMESLTFDGAALQPFDRTALSRLADDLRPGRLRHLPFYVPTLFQSPTALPRAVPAGDAAPIVPLRDALRPIFTPAMDLAYRRGQAVASLFRNVYAQTALVVDLPGPEAVAFAAGAAEVLDPIFLFDNWPHPRGVVPSHLTLAAAAYFQPLFARHATPPGAAPMFVLDRNRLAPYTDDDTEFDNRYVARVPSAPVLRSMDVLHVLYVTPTSADLIELDDLNEDFTAYAAGGIDVKILSADELGPDPAVWSEPTDLEGGGGLPYVALPRDDERRRCWYGFSMATHFWFWNDYGWVRGAPHPPQVTPRAPAMQRSGPHYRPMHRVSAFSMGQEHAAGLKPVPPQFGHVRVVVAARTGVLLGAAASRSGSWGRTSSSSSGG